MLMTFVVAMTAMVMSFLVTMSTVIFVIAGAFRTVAMLGGLLLNFHDEPLSGKFL
jgi:hypothetical protein